jgi:hypothetical protein
VHVAFGGVAQQAAEGLAAASGVGGDGLGVAGEDGGGGAGVALAGCWLVEVVPALAWTGTYLALKSTGLIGGR